MTPEQALANVSRLTAAFRPRDWSKESAVVYAEALMDLRAEDLSEATVLLVRRMTYMPTVADIRAETRRVRDRRIGDTSKRVPRADPDDVAGYLRDLREGNFRDEDEPRALTRRPMPPTPFRSVRDA